MAASNRTNKTAGAPPQSTAAPVVKTRAAATVTPPQPLKPSPAETLVEVLHGVWDARAEIRNPHATEAQRVAARVSIADRLALAFDAMIER